MGPSEHFFDGIVNEQDLVRHQRQPAGEDEQGEDGGVRDSPQTPT